MNPQLNIVPVVEPNNPLPPRKPGGRRPTVHYDFSVIPVGGSGRFSKSLGAIQAKMYKYQREHPGTRFIARQVTKTLTRVWRLK